VTHHCKRANQCFLLGNDPITGKNVDHRKRWIEDRRQHVANRFGFDSLVFAVMFNHVYSNFVCSLFWPSSLFLVLSLKGCHILCRGRRPRYPVNWNRKGLKGRHTNLHVVRSSRLPISSLMCQPSGLLSSFWFRPRVITLGRGCTSPSGLNSLAEGFVRIRLAFRF